MAGNRRGKLKEHYEGIHRNFEWCKQHVAKILVLIGDEKHPLHKASVSLGEGIQALDDLANDVYAKI